MSQRKGLRTAVAAIALAAALSATGVAYAHDEPMPAGASGVKSEMLMWIQDADDKLGQLAEAMPERKYAWRPDKEVRSMGEVFMHVAAANYGIPAFIGIPAPAGFRFELYEGSLTKKADIVKALKDSFAHMEAGLKGMSDADMDKPAEFFGMKTTGRGAYMLILSHCHEHLGQAIAYARSNGVVPPWTAKQKAEEAKAAKK